MVSITKYETSEGTRYRINYRKPDGRLTAKRGFLRKRDAEEWAAEHVTRAKTLGTYVDPQAGLKRIGEIYEEWMTVKKPLWKESQRESIEASWRTHCRKQWENRHVGDVTHAEIQQWISRLAAQRSASVTIRACGIMRAIFDKAVLDRLIASNPCQDIELPRKPKRKGKHVYLTIPELIALADECDKAQQMGESRRALVLTLGFCGIRWGEAAALRICDVDLTRGCLNISRSIVQVKGKPVEGTPKSYECRQVPMPRIVSEALGGIIRGRADQDERVFSDPNGGPIRPQSASTAKGNRTWWPSALRRLGWRETKWPSPHDLRHTAASIAVSAGANVKALQRMLGHASAAMTLDVYADLFDSDLLDVARMIDAAVQVQAPAEKRCQNVVTQKEISAKTS